MNAPKLIKDIPTDIDAFGPHKKIAEAILAVIAENKQPEAIALLGEWGSGKSSIIKITEALAREKEEQNINSYRAPKIISYDAWEYESDLLRNSILSVLADELGAQKEIKTKIWQTTEETQKPKNPHVKKQIAFALSLMGFLLGVELIGTVNFDTLPFSLNYSDTDESVKFWFSIGFILLPPLLLLIFNMCNEDDKFLESFLPFLGGQDTSSDDIAVKNISSSIEEFYNLMDEIITGYTGEREIVLILDNLDRIEGERAREIWSAMSPLFTHERESKIWIIAALSEGSIIEMVGPKKLVKLDPRSSHFSTPIYDEPIYTIDKNRHLGFLNKTFSRIYDVPSPILGKASDFISNKIDELNIKRLSDDDRKQLLSLIRTSNLINKQPRDLIKFLNAFEQSLCLNDDSEIPVLAHAYYLLKDTSKFTVPEKYALYVPALHYGIPFKNAQHIEFNEKIRTLFMRDHFESPQNEKESQSLKDDFKSLVTQPYFKECFSDQVSEFLSDFSTAYDLRTYKDIANALMFINTECHFTCDYWDKLWKNAVRSFKENNKSNGSDDIYEHKNIWSLLKIIRIISVLTNIKPYLIEFNDLWDKSLEGDVSDYSTEEFNDHADFLIKQKDQPIKIYPVQAVYFYQFTQKHIQKENLGDKIKNREELLNAFNEIISTFDYTNAMYMIFPLYIEAAGDLLMRLFINTLIKDYHQKVGDNGLKKLIGNIASDSTINSIDFPYTKITAMRLLVQNMTSTFENPFQITFSNPLNNIFRSSHRNHKKDIAQIIFMYWLSKRNPNQAFNDDDILFKRISYKDMARKLDPEEEGHYKIISLDSETPREIKNVIKNVEAYSGHTFSDVVSDNNIYRTIDY